MRAWWCLAGATVGLVGCGGSTNGSDLATSDPHGHPGDDASADASGDGAQAQDAIFANDTSVPPSDGACANGAACGDAGVCVSGTCCDRDKVCGPTCCGAGNVCSFEQCVAPGATCVDRSDCAGGEYCEYSLGEALDAGAQDAACTGGFAPRSGKCLPLPPTCAPDAGVPDGGIACLQACEVKPTTSAFSFAETYSWGGVTASPFTSDVMMAPIVVELDDDNCDGKVNAEDIPEIVFVTFTGGSYTTVGTLHAISIVGGQVVEKLSVPGLVRAASGLAAGDLDGDGVAEIVACLGTSGTTDSGVVALHADGSVYWKQTDTTKVHCGGYEMPAIADPAHTGHPQVLVGVTLLDGQTGAVAKEFNPATTAGPRITGFSDVDGDGALDAVEGARAWKLDGTAIWDFTKTTPAVPSGYHAVGDLDLDGKPEVAVVSGTGPHTLAIVRLDPTSGAPTIVRRALDINGTLSASLCPTGSAGNTRGGGAPTIADFDGDGHPDVGLAGGVGYSVWSGAKLMDPNVADADTLLWIRQTHDCSSAVTGSSVFDFNGDGAAEVAYSDEIHLWLFDGKTGTSLIPETCNTTGTLWEYPLVANVDADGHADLVVASNAYAITCNGTKQSGIRVFGSADVPWVRTRRVWNEHTYHVTNVNEDGTIPVTEPTNWLQPGLDDYRQNKQPGAEFAAPNAIVSVAVTCDATQAVVATVRNVGQASLPAGVVVGFYSGTAPSGTKLGSAATANVLYPADSEDVVLPLSPLPADIASGQTWVYAVVDDGSPAHPAWTECRTDDDVSLPAKAQCNVPH